MLRKKWLFKGLFTESFFEEPKMVVLLHCYKKPTWNTQHGHFIHLSKISPKD